MRVFESSDPEGGMARSHPWTVVESNASLRYEDLRRHPERIRSSLEDFQVLDTLAAGERFYRLVEWLNGVASPFESNDCALWAVEPNESGAVEGRLVVSGRLMILFRELRQNTERERVAALVLAAARACNDADRSFVSGAIGLTVVAVHYRSLPKRAQAGEQLMLSFWAAGNTLPELWQNLDRTFVVLAGALQSSGVRATAA